MGQVLRTQARGGETDMKQSAEDRPHWYARAIAAGTLAGGVHGYMRPHSAFSGGMERGGKTLKGRLAGGVVGATLGASVGAMPQIVRDALNEHEHYSTKSKSAGISRERLVKHAMLDPVSMAGMGALSHVGTNLVVGGLRKAEQAAAHGTGSELVQNIGRRWADTQADMFHNGFKNKITGKPQSLLATIGQNWVAPEVWQPQAIGGQAAEALRGMSPYQRKHVLKKLRSGLAENPELLHTPIVSDFLPGINRILADPSIVRGAQQAPGIAHKIAPAVIGAGMLAGPEPGAAIHALVNKTRMLVADSPMGQQFFKDMGKKGLSEGMGTTIPTVLDGVKNRLLDIGLSPAARDSQEAAKAMTEHALRNPERAGKLMAALQPVARRMPQVQSLMTGMRNALPMQAAHEGMAGMADAAGNMANAATSPHSLYLAQQNIGHAEQAMKQRRNLLVQDGMQANYSTPEAAQAAYDASAAGQRDAAINGNISAAKSKLDALSARNTQRLDDKFFGAPGFSGIPRATGPVPLQGV